MSTYIFEIGTEELPVTFAYDALTHIRNTAIKWLEENRLRFEKIEVYSTPRRIACQIKKIKNSQEPIVKETRGPAKNFAFTDNSTGSSPGDPTKAAMGFAKSQGVDVNDLVIKEVNGKEFIFAIKKEEGKNAEEILPKLVPYILNNIPIHRSMKWGSSKLTFIRPIHWILSMLNNKVISFNIDSISCSDLSYGHRFLSNRVFKVTGAENYVEELRNHFVIVNIEERENSIKQQIENIVKEIDGKAISSFSDEQLLKEVTQLVEYPTAILGSFDTEFLNIPDVVIMTVMRVHQRYFPVLDKNNKLLPYFITISNGNQQFYKNIKIGNENVIKARLSDASFYFKNDINKSLFDRIPDLKRITFFEGMGSLFDKTKRLQKLTLKILEEFPTFIPYPLVHSDSVSPNIAERAAMLCKTDLTTRMVKEFTELQGQIGYYYALNNGEPEEVAVAIKEHYLPTAEGILPKTPLGRILSIADKIDNLVCCFALNIIPSGSKDPHALRRQTLGIIAITEDANMHFNINKYLNFALDLLQLNNEKKEEIKNNLTEFIKGRFRQNLIDRGFRYDIVDSVFNSFNPLDDLWDTQAKVKSLLSWVTSYYDDALKVIMAVNRPIRITRGLEFNKGVKDALFQIESEQLLFDKAKELKDVYDKKLKNKDFLGALEASNLIVDPINNFFDNVMVMVEDTGIKNNRLALLESIEEIFLQIADFGVIVI